MREEDKENIELIEYLTAAQNIVMKKIMRQRQDSEEPPSDD